MRNSFVNLKLGILTKLKLLRNLRDKPRKVTQTQLISEVPKRGTSL